MIGSKVTDRVTGLTGICTGVAKFMSDGDCTLIQPPAKSDGTLPQSVWINDNRIDIDLYVEKVVAAS